MDGRRTLSWAVKRRAVSGEPLYLLGPMVTITDGRAGIGEEGQRVARKTGVQH